MVCLSQQKTEIMIIGVVVTVQQVLYMAVVDGGIIIAVTYINHILYRSSFFAVYVLPNGVFKSFVFTEMKIRPKNVKHKIISELNFFLYDLTDFCAYITLCGYIATIQLVAIATHSYLTIYVTRDFDVLYVYTH